MNSFADKFQEALTAARKSVRMKIRKHSGEEEEFDPEALLYSLFEAEVPFKHTFGLFERIVERLVPFNVLNEMTERQLHGLVATEISAYPDGSASLWVTNYHNVYTLDSEFGQEEIEEAIDFNNTEALVPARKASLIRRLIKDYLAKELEVSADEVSDFIDTEDLREATNRVLKFVRFAGLADVPLATLRLFIEAFSTHSQKKFIYHRLRDEELAREIALAERSFEAARKLSDTDPFQALTEFRFALELVGRIFLTACNLASRPARQHSFQYLLTLLRTLDHKNRKQRTQELPPSVARRVDSALAGIAQYKEYQIKTLREAADLLAVMLTTMTEALGTSLFDEGSPIASAAFDEGASAFQSLLYTARSLHGVGIGRSRIVDALRAAPEERAGRVCEATADFIREELHLKYEEVQSQSGLVLRVLDLARLKIHADCLRHGHDAVLLFRFGHTGEPLSRAQVQDFLYEVLADSSCFGIIFSDQMPDTALLKELRRLSELAGRRGVIIWMDTNALTRMFLRPDGFLATVDEYLKRALPWLNDAADQARAEDYEMITSEITGYVRESLAVLNRYEAEREWAAIRAEITPFLEELASDYKYYLGQLVLRAIPEPNRAAIDKALSEGHLLGSSSRFVDYCLHLPVSTASLPPSLVKGLETFRNFISRVRPHRNRLVHEHGSASDVASVLRVMTEALLELVLTLPYPDLYLCLRASEHELSAAPLFGAPERPQGLPGAQAGLVLAVWNAGTAEEVVLPKRLKPNRTAAAATPLIFDPKTGNIADEAKGQGKLSNILLRTLRDTSAKVEETSKQIESPARQGDLSLISTWLMGIPANPLANAMPALKVATLGEYDLELANLAVREALEFALGWWPVQVEITTNAHGLVMQDNSGGRIGCSVFDQSSLRDDSRIQEEIDYWTNSQAAGRMHNFAFLFADPLECKEEIRNFKRMMLTSDKAREFYALDRILEPEHTYFLLQRTNVESNHTGNAQRSGTGGDSSTQPVRKEVSARYDVFISYNSEDREEVRQIVNQLKEASIIPWFDEEELRPGSLWTRELEEQIEHTASAAVFLGNKGEGPWQREEVDAILRRFISLGRRVIPVILPNGNKDPNAAAFLVNRTWVDFRSSSPPPLKQLIWGITGKKPN